MLRQLWQRLYPRLYEEKPDKKQIVEVRGFRGQLKTLIFFSIIEYYYFLVFSTMITVPVLLNANKPNEENSLKSISVESVQTGLLMDFALGVVSFAAAYYHTHRHCKNLACQRWFFKYKAPTDKSQYEINIQL
ncbi:hypothetical protein NUACC21_34300 [Scytonema sp. NUACC21]